MVGDILQPTHLLLILVVALLVLGPERLPEVARTLGSGIRDFRSAISGESASPRAEPEYVDAAPDLAGEPSATQHVVQAIREPDELASADAAVPPPLVLLSAESPRSGEPETRA